MKKSFFATLAALCCMTLTGFVSCGTGSDDTGSVSFVIDGAKLVQAVKNSALAGDSQALFLSSREAETTPTIYVPTTSDKEFAEYASMPPVACYVSEYTKDVSLDKSDASNRTATVKITSAYIFYENNTFLVSTYADFSSLIEAIDLSAASDTLSQETIDQMLADITAKFSIDNGIWNSGSYTLSGNFLNGTITLGLGNAAVPLPVTNGTFSLALEGTDAEYSENGGPLAFTRVSTFKTQSASDVTISYNDDSTSPASPDTNEEITITIALIGSNQKQAGKFSATSKPTKFNFDNIRAGTQVRAVAIVTGKNVVHYYGISESKTITSGRNDDIELRLQNTQTELGGKIFSYQGTAEGEPDTFELAAYELERGKQEGLWAIEHLGGLVSMGAYTILSFDAEKNPASVSVTEYVYMNTEGNFMIADSPRAQILSLADTFTFASASGKRIVFGKSSDDDNGDDNTGDDDTGDDDNVSGNITTESDSILISIAEQSAPTLYLNKGSITLAAKLKDTNLASEEIDWSARLLYKGKDLNENASELADKYYVMEGNMVMLLEGKPLPAAGSYQLFVTAEYNGIAGSSTFDLTVADMAYYEIDVTGTTTDTIIGIFDPIAECNADIYLKVTGTSDVSHTNICSVIKTAVSNSSHYVNLDLKEVKSTAESKIINGSAMSATSSLVSLIMPDEVEETDYYAFSACENLKTVTIGSNLKTVGSGTFNGCSGLESVIYPEDCKVTTISQQAFSGCISLKDFTIPASLVAIHYSAFYKSGFYNSETKVLDKELLFEGDVGTWYYTQSSDTLNRWISGELTPPDKSETDTYAGTIADMTKITSNYVDNPDYVFNDHGIATDAQKVTVCASCSPDSNNNSGPTPRTLYLYRAK